MEISSSEVIAGVVVVPLIMGLVSVFTRMGLRKHYAPALSVVFGLLISLGYAAMNQVGGVGLGYYQAVMVGLGLGLTACHLYSPTAQVFTATGKAIKGENVQHPQPCLLTKPPEPKPRPMPALNEERPI